MGLRLEFVTNFLDRNNYSVRRKGGFLLYARNSPYQHIPLPIRLLGMKNRHVWIDCADGHHRLSRKGAGHRCDRGRVLRQIGTEVSIQ